MLKKYKAKAGHPGLLYYYHCPLFSELSMGLATVPPDMRNKITPNKVIPVLFSNFFLS